MRGMRKRSKLEGFKLYYEDLPSTPRIKRRQKPANKLATLRKPNRPKAPHHKTRRRRPAEGKRR